MENFDDNFLEQYYDENAKSLFQDEHKEEKFFNKVLNFIARKKGVSSNHSDYVDYSVFEHIANSTDLHSLTKENHLAVREAVSISEEALHIFKQKILFLNRSQSTNDKISKMEIFNTLEPKEIDYLKMILGRYESLIKERNVTDAQLSSFSRNCIYLIDILDETVENLPKIEDAEKTQRIFKQDINHIEGEKQELLDEMETLIIGRDFFGKFTYAFIGLSVLFSIWFSFAGIFYEKDIFMQLFVLIITVVVVGTATYIVRKKISSKMRYNIAFQKRAVELLNKKNAVFAYYTNYLNFEYNKYKINSSNELRSFLKEVQLYKQTQKRASNVRKVVRESEIEIYGFLDKHKIKNLKMSLLQFAQTINIDDQRRSFMNLTEEKDKIDTILVELDEKYDLVINKLNELNDNDNTPNRVIQNIVSTYYQEVEKIVEEYA